MYKNLNAAVLGVSGRQSELIELALTYGFRGMDVNMTELLKRAESRGTDWAARFIRSANNSSNFDAGGFDLPICWQKSADVFNTDMEKMDAMLELCSIMGITRCQTAVCATNDEMPYHEYFEAARERLGQIGERLATKNIKMGLELQSAPSQREVGQHQFIYQAEAILTLIEMVGADNVGLALDTWFWRVGEGGLDQLSELDGKRFISVRLADLPASADPSTVEIDQRALPGESGSIDFPALMRMLSEKEFDGPVTVYAKPGAIEGTRDKIVQKAGAIIDDMWREGGLNRAGKVADVAPVTPVEEPIEPEVDAEAEADPVEAKA